MAGCLAAQIAIVHQARRGHRRTRPARSSRAVRDVAGSAFLPASTAL